MTQPETARALLHRHGLPEDIIDGALCLHAQELAAVQRAALAKTDDPVFYEGEAGWLVNLIEPSRTPAAVSAAVAPPTDRAAVLHEAADRFAAFDLHAEAAALRRMADETPEPPTVAWHILTHQRGTWRPWLAPRDNSTEAREDYDQCVADNGHRWAFRLVRETSTFTVEAEHQPAAGARQDGATS